MEILRIDGCVKVRNDNGEIVDLCGTDLRGTDLRGANLHGADLQGANLRSANLCDAKLNWCSHNLIAEILRQAAVNDVDKLKWAGFVAMQAHKCWDYFELLGDPQYVWGLSVLAPRADENAPIQVRAYVRQQTLKEEMYHECV